MTSQSWRQQSMRRLSLWKSMVPDMFGCRSSAIPLKKRVGWSKARVDELHVALFDQMASPHTLSPLTRARRTDYHSRHSCNCGACTATHPSAVTSCREGATSCETSAPGGYCGCACWGERLLELGVFPPPTLVFAACAVVLNGWCLRCCLPGVFPLVSVALHPPIRQPGAFESRSIDGCDDADVLIPFLSIWMTTRRLRRSAGSEGELGDVSPFPMLPSPPPSPRALVWVAFVPRGHYPQCT